MSNLKGLDLYMMLVIIASQILIFYTFVIKTLIKNFLHYKPNDWLSGRISTI